VVPITLKKCHKRHCEEGFGPMWQSLFCYNYIIMLQISILIEEGRLPRRFAPRNDANCHFSVATSFFVGCFNGPFSPHAAMLVPSAIIQINLNNLENISIARYD